MKSVSKFNRPRTLFFLAGAIIVFALMLSFCSIHPAVAQTPTPTPTPEYCWGNQTSMSFSNSGTGDYWFYPETGDFFLATSWGSFTSLDNVNYTGNVDVRHVQSSNSAHMESGTVTWPNSCQLHEGVPTEVCGWATFRGYDNSQGSKDEMFQPGGWHTGGSGTYRAGYAILYKCADITTTVQTEECGLPVITDTHFAYNTWTTSNAPWSPSQYHIYPGGSIQKSGVFSISNVYSVTVLAQTTSTGTLTINIGGTSSPITVSNASSFNWYSALLNLQAGTHTINLSSAGSNSAIINVDRICINYGSAMTCGVINDPDMRMPTSWTGLEGVTSWDYHQWHLEGYMASIKQNISIIQAGMYSVTILAKSDTDVDSVYLDIELDSQQMAEIEIPVTATTFLAFTTTFNLPLGGHEFKIKSTGWASIDYVCVAPGVLGIAGPCGITPEDVANSGNYIDDSQLEIGLALPTFQLGSGQFPIPVVPVSIDSSWDLLQGWYTSGMMPGIFEVGAEGLTRWRSGTHALGVLPTPLHYGIYQHLKTPLGSQPYNTVLRIRRMWDNAQLSVNGASITNTVKGEWAEVAYYTSGDPLHITSNCRDLVCSGGLENKYDVVQIDDVYVVPGPSLCPGGMASCVCSGNVVTETTPLGQCINQNPHFDEGETGWTFNGSASVSIPSWARVPPGSSIEQFIPAATAGSTWGQQTSGVMVGNTYSVSIRARLESVNEPGGLAVEFGASTPGQQTYNLVLTQNNPTDIATPSFLVTADMLEGSNIILRLANEAGGTVMVDSICVRDNENGSVIPPNGNCIGTWLSSNGGSAISQTIPVGSYVYNTTPMYGGYVLDIAGSTTGNNTNDWLEVSYVNHSTGLSDTVTGFVVDQNFGVSRSFVAPPGGYYNGQLEIQQSWGNIVYNSICLREDTNGPGDGGGTPPGPLPYPDCSSVTSMVPRNAAFFILGTYSVTNQYSETLPAAYVAELTYNYAIYPLVCTTVSIANWQYSAYYSWLAKFEAFSNVIQDKLDQIINVLWAIYNKLNAAPPTCGVLDIMLWIFKAVFALFLKILGLIGQIIGLVTNTMRKINVELHGENQQAFPISCSGDGQWMCMGLAAMLALDQSYGGWLNIIAQMVVAMLTVSLVWWVVNQLRAMLQPGSEPSNED